MANPCICKVEDGQISYNNGASLQVTIPSNDGVYTADGSPPIGSHVWNKPKDSEGFMHITYSVVLPKDGQLVNIPKSHNLLIAIKTAFTTIQLDCMLKFDLVPFTTPDAVDISIKFDDGSDPIFVQTPSALAYTYFPNTRPQGAFCSVYNLKFALDLQNINFHYDANEILRHELRHGIGLVHTTQIQDLMYPFYTERRRPTAMDIYQEQFCYGARTPPVNPIQVNGFYNMDSRNVEFIA